MTDFPALKRGETIATSEVEKATVEAQQHGFAVFLVMCGLLTVLHCQEGETKRSTPQVQSH